MQAVFDRLVTLLPKSWQPVAKAIVPVELALAGAVAQWGATGTFDLAEVLTAAGGILAGLLVFKTPNTGALLVVNKSGATGNKPPRPPRRAS